MTNIPDGYGFVGPRGRKTAIALLAAAEAAGLETSVVRAQSDGYLAPDAVVKEYEKSLGATEDVPEEEAPQGPDKTWKNADIKAFAEENNIDLGSATSKADMLSAINAATKEE